MEIKFNSDDVLASEENTRTLSHGNNSQICYW